MIPFSILPEIRDAFPDIHVGLMTGMVINSDYDDKLWEEISVTTKELNSKLSLESIREIPPIKIEF